MIRLQLWSFWLSVEYHQHLLSDVHAISNNSRCRAFHGRNIHKNCLIWAKSAIISNLSNRDSPIIQNHFLHCCNVMIGCWWSLISSRPSLNWFYLNWTCVLIYSQDFKYPFTFNFIPYTKLNTNYLIHFFG